MTFVGVDAELNLTPGDIFAWGRVPRELNSSMIVNFWSSIQKKYISFSSTSISLLINVTSLAITWLVDGCLFSALITDFTFKRKPKNLSELTAFNVI